MAMPLSDRNQASEPKPKTFLAFCGKKFAEFTKLLGHFFKTIHHPYRWLVVFTVFMWVIVGVNWFPIGDLQPTAVGVSETITWDGGGDGTDWNDTANWDLNRLPTSGDSVVIDIAATVSTTAAISFANISLGDGVGSVTSTLKLGHAITAGTNITIFQGGELTQVDDLTETITGTLEIRSGGYLTHQANTTTQDHELDWNVATFDLQSGGFVFLNGKGFEPSGNGSGGGGSSASSAGAGGAHAGDGGDSTGATGGTGYCDVTNPATVGSSGGFGPSGQLGGAGGGLFILNASGTATINGTITADGHPGQATTGGGGAGGGIKIDAAIVAGTPQGASVSGGDGGATSSGGGGGGCVLLSYTTSNSISATSTVSMGGGTGGNKRGGGGYAYVKQDGTDGDLYSVNSGASGASSTQGATSITANSLTINTSTVYLVPSGNTLVLRDVSPFDESDATGSLQIASGAIFTPTSTTDFEIASSTLIITSGSTITSSSSLDVFVEYDGALDMRSFTTSSAAQPFNTLMIHNGANLTHGQNTTTQTHVINISVASSTIEAGGSINVDGKGYEPHSSAATSNGPGGGGSSASVAGSGGAHAGDGGDTGGASGGTGYCDVTDPGTIGSSGGFGPSGEVGGYGGGLIVFAATGDFTINGTITADGGVGDATRGGGGAGGGVKLTAADFKGTPQSFTTTGGNGGSSGTGGGGGGCALLSFTTSNSIVVTSSITMSGGTGGAERGGAGYIYTKQSGTDGDLYSINGGSGETSTQGAETLTVDTLVTQTSATYLVPSGRTFVMQNSDPLADGDATGSLQLASGAIFTPTSTVDFTITSTTVILDAGATFTSSNNINVVVSDDGIFDMRSFTTSSDSLTLNTLLINDGGTLTHGTNDTTQTNVIYISATSSTVAVGGAIDVDGKGYGSSGNGPGGGTNTASTGGGGAGHGGAGGAGGVSGGSAYCIASDPGTIGSSGGSGAPSQAGGAGGGFIELDITGTLTINGTVTADGGNGTDSSGGGGAGGGVQFTANVIAGSPQSFTITGGASGATEGGGGAGGCALFNYTSSISLIEDDVTKTGGVGGNNNGAVGLFSTAIVNVTSSGTGGSTPAPPSEPEPSGENPTGATFLINDGARTTFIRDVDVTVYLPKATSVTLSSEPTFTGAKWVRLDSIRDNTVPFVLPDGAGSKIIYAKFETVNGAVSQVYRQVITYQTTQAPALVIDIPEQGAMVSHNLTQRDQADFQTVSVAGHGVFEDKTTVLTLYQVVTSIDQEGERSIAYVPYLASEERSQVSLFPSAISDADKKWNASFPAVDTLGAYRLTTNIIDDSSGDIVATQHRDFTLVAATRSPQPGSLGEFMVNHGQKYTNELKVPVYIYAQEFTHFVIDLARDINLADKQSTVAVGEPWEGEFILPEKDGVYFLGFVAFDKTGESIYRRRGMVVLDRTPPKTPEVNYQLQKVQTGRSDSQTQLVLSGKTEPFAQVIVTKTSPDIPQPIAGVLRIAGVTTQTTEAAANGDWELSFSGLQNGKHTLAVSVQDRADNTSDIAEVSVIAGDDVPDAPAEPPEDPSTEPESQPDPTSTDPAPSDQPTGPAPSTPTPAAPEPSAPSTPAPSAPAAPAPDAAAPSTPASTSTPEPVTLPTPVIVVEPETSTSTMTTSSDEAPLAQRTIYALVTGYEAVATFVDDPQVEQVTEEIATPVLATVATVNVVSSAAALPSIPPYLYLLLSQFFGLFGRRKKQWGVVFNALTRLPIDLALIRLVDDATGRVIQTRVTDTYGRFGFFAAEGSYRIEVTKRGFAFPAPYLAGKTEDVHFGQLYDGGKIQITSASQYITPNIALDPQEDARAVSRISRDQVLKHLQRIVSFSGIAAAGVSFVISPTIIVTLALAFHILTFVFLRRVRGIIKPTQWGVVADAQTRRALGKAVVRLFDAQYNKLLETQVTHGNGRYAFLVGPNTYYLTYEKSGYTRKKTDEVVITNVSDMIARDEKLTPGTQQPTVRLAGPHHKPLVDVVEDNTSRSASEDSSGSEQTPAPPAPPQKPTATSDDQQTKVPPSKNESPEFDFAKMREMALYGREDKSGGHYDHTADVPKDKTQNTS